MSCKTLRLKSETNDLNDKIFNIMKEIKTKLAEGYKIDDILKMYDENKDYPYITKVEFIKEDE